MNEILNDDIITFFEWYVLHDTPVRGLHFDFQKQTINMVFENYDDFIHDFIEGQFIFKKVHTFTFDYPVEDFYFEIKDIYSAKLEKITDQSYELSLKVTMPAKDTGLEWDVGKMLIGFADLEVIGGLSREAMEYKWKAEEE